MAPHVPDGVASANSDLSGVDLARGRARLRRQRSAGREMQVKVAVHSVESSRGGFLQAGGRWTGPAERERLRGVGRFSATGSWGGAEKVPEARPADGQLDDRSVGLLTGNSSNALSKNIFKRW